MVRYTRFQISQRNFGLGSGLGLGWLGLGLELGLGTQDLKFHKKFQHFVFEILKKKKTIFCTTFSFSILILNSADV